MSLPTAVDIAFRGSALLTRESALRGTALLKHLHTVWSDTTPHASVPECARAYGQRARAGPHSESRVLARVTHAGTEICGWPRDSEIGNLLEVL